MRLWLPLFLVLALVPAPASTGYAETASSAAKKAEIKNPEDLKLLDAGKVKEILKSDLILLENNKRYRLDAIRIPPLLSNKAEEELNTLLSGKMAGAYSGRPEWETRDRFDVPLSHIVNEDGAWVQSQLVAKGLAWVNSTASGQPLIQKLLKKEEKARKENLGLWGSPAFRIKTANEAHEFINSFQLVEGKVVAITSKIDFLFINFGKDWKTDFSIMIKRENINDFLGRYPEYQPNTWANKKIRVRGWIEESHGPMIEVTHKDQIEFVKEEEKKEDALPAP